MDVLTHLGARVMAPPGHSGEQRIADLEGGWESLAGGEAIRQQVEEAILFPLRRPEVFDAVMRATRANSCAGVAANRRTALLFHGPPGTGKTSVARIAAHESNLPLVYAPLEALFSKWYGQGEQQLAALFAACEPLGPAILFLDEIDALATSRNKEMHEASRRMLSVLLRRMDGMDATAQTSLIAATNRPQDLDSALLSRFDVRVAFPLPEAAARAQIFARYAKQLDTSALEAISLEADNLSGRDILDVCRAVERRWVSMLLRGEVDGLPRTWDASAQPPLPGMKEYIAAIRERRAITDE